MRSITKDITKRLQLGNDSIYFYSFVNSSQAEEIRMRESVASRNYKDYLSDISYHHSIPVMDREIEMFLKKIPKNGTVIDIGGCWGWHWRRNRRIRPDVTVFIVDFVRQNLAHAKNVLGDQVNDNIVLVHGDATSLVFDDNTFDGCWSVQTLQHIPDLKKAVTEAWRVLKPGGIFTNYSFNNQALLKLYYRMRGVHYHVSGHIPGSFYLERASVKQLRLLEEVFSNRVLRRYTEVVFCPELRMSFCGKENSVIGKIDSFLSSGLPIFSCIARQQSFHTFKR